MASWFDKLRDKAVDAGMAKAKQPYGDWENKLRREAGAEAIKTKGDEQRLAQVKKFASTARPESHQEAAMTAEQLDDLANRAPESSSKSSPTKPPTVVGASVEPEAATSVPSPGDWRKHLESLLEAGKPVSFPKAQYLQAKESSLEKHGEIPGLSLDQQAMEDLFGQELELVQDGGGKVWYRGMSRGRPHVVFFAHPEEDKLHSEGDVGPVQPVGQGE